MQLWKSLSLLTVLMLGTAAHAQTLIFGATLNGASESPPTGSSGTGSATVTIDQSLQTMRVQIAFSGLSGTTTASHIHAATASAGAGTAGVATQTPNFSGFPLGVSSGTYDNTFDMTQASSFNATYVTNNGGTAASAFTALIQAMQDGKAYLNIHSTTNTGGEIRGFLAPVPEPTTIATLGLGVVALLRRRRHR